GQPKLAHVFRRDVCQAREMAARPVPAGIVPVIARADHRGIDLGRIAGLRARGKREERRCEQLPHFGHAPRYCSSTERSVRGLRPVTRSTSSDTISMKPSRMDWPKVTMPSLAQGIGPSGITSEALRGTPS